MYVCVKTLGFVSTENSTGTMAVNANAAGFQS